jgi:fluoroquinolone transport system permease protein
MSSLAALLRRDARVIYRDSLLVFLPIYALVLALAMRWGLPLVPVDDLALYLAPCVVLFGALLLGTVLGFALIEEREQGTWLLLRVLPVRQRALFVYLAGLSSLLSAGVGLLAALIYGQPVADYPAFFSMLLSSSLLAPLVMLVLGVAASNKIEGLAVSKVLSASFLLPAVVFVAPMPWQLAIAWFPGYWVYLGLLEAYAGDPTALALYWPGYPLWLEIAAPALLSLAAVRLLARAFGRRAA